MYGYLAHYGVKGMKWGIRRYQNYNGELTALGRQHYGYKPVEVKTFDKNQRAEINFKYEGERELKKFKKEGGVGELLNVAKDNNSVITPKNDIIIKKGSQFQRITTTKDESMLNRLYVTQRVQDYYIPEFLKENSFVRVYSLNKDVKLAGRDTVNEILHTYGGKNLGSRTDFKYHNKPGTRYATLSWYKFSNEDLFSNTSSDSVKKVQNLLIKDLTKRGYSGLIDPMDAGSWSSSAYIITDKSLRKIKDLTIEEAAKKYKIDMDTVFW